MGIQGFFALWGVVVSTVSAHADMADLSKQAADAALVTSVNEADARQAADETRRAAQSGRVPEAVAAAERARKAAANAWRAADQAQAAERRAALEYEVIRWKAEQQAKGHRQPAQSRQSGAR